VKIGNAKFWAAVPAPRLDGGQHPGWSAGRNGDGISPFGDEHDPAGVGVGRQGQIAMAALVGGLVNRRSIDGRQVCAPLMSRCVHDRQAFPSVETS
jgi:hypothetical protein